MGKWRLTAAATAILTCGLMAATASAVAPPGPGGAVHVARSMDNAGTSYVTISWASEGSDSDGSLVCVQPGTTAPSTPDSCESRIAVDPPTRSSGLVPIQLHRNYTFSVFSYKGTT